MSRTAFVCYCFLYVLTFTVLAPHLCARLIYSVYFDEDQVDAHEVLKAANEARRTAAESHMRRLDAARTKLDYDRRLSDQQMEQLDVLVVIKTVDRTSFYHNPDTGYLTQTVAAFDREIAASGDDLQLGLVICNADPDPGGYKEATKLVSYFPSVQRWGGSARSTPPPPHYPKRQKEKDDYAYCLAVARNQSRRAHFLLLVEDDAEPYPGLFGSLKYVVERRIEARRRTPWAYLRLYYPERWTGFGWEARPVCELVALGALGGSFFRAAAAVRTSRSHRGSVEEVAHFVAGAVYVALLAFVVGRQYLQEVRRHAVDLFSVESARPCCTPAVLYPSDVVDDIVRFLDNVTCSATFGVDLALDQFAEQARLDRFLVQPNLVHHRGAYSSLTEPKRLAEFLFDAF